MAQLLVRLREAGADEQAATLAGRAAAHAALDDPRAVADLLDRLREAGAHQQVITLVARLPAAGMFGLFLHQDRRADRFWFGREPDGTPAAPWDWDDLDLSPARQPREAGKGRVRRLPECPVGDPGRDIQKHGHRGR